MGWGTTFKVEVYLNRQVFSYRSEVKFRLKEIEDIVNTCKQDIAMLVAVTPKDYSNEENPLFEMKTELNDTMEYLEDRLVERTRLKLYLEYLEENNIEKIEHNGNY